MTLKVDNKARALIFDLDGTLADTMPTHYLAWQQVAQNHNFHFPEKLFYDLAGVPTREIANILNKKYNLSLDPLRTEEEKEKNYLTLAGKNIKPILVVVNVLKEHYNKIPVACGTGNNKEIALLTLKAIGLEGIFDILVTADDVERPKPYPDTFLLCAEKMKVAPEICQVFEDGLPGIEAAKKAKMIPTDVRPYLK